MALMWQLAMLAQVVFDRRQRKKGKRQRKKGNIKVNFWNFSSEMNCLCRDQFFLSFLIFLKKKKSCFPLYLCFVMTVKNSLFDWICHWRHSVNLMDSLDGGPGLAGSIFFRCFFFSLMTLWKQVYPLQQTERWVVLFDILYCYMPVYKNANDNHRKGHLDYCRASLSCLFLSVLLSLRLFPNLSSLHLEFDS